MIQAKELMPSVEDYLDSLVYSRHVEEQELLALVQKMCVRRLNRLQGLDPQRNK